MTSLVNNQSSSSALSFSLDEIKRATNYFTSKISEFSVDNADVYRGNISSNAYSGEVFIIRLHMWIGGTTWMLENEIEVFTICHHVNIISLLGLCNENHEGIFVYEFMPNNSLYDYLYTHKNMCPRLNVEQRLEVCLGVAKGLCHLHSGTDFNIVHRKMNSKSILLDASLVPKVSVFTHAMISVADQSSSQETNTKGRHVYCPRGYYSPPEWDVSGYKASTKGDVYAFGVLLLEVLCERKPDDRLLVLALPAITKGELPKCTPEHVKENITPACAEYCAKVVIDCLEVQPNKRPCMNQVVEDLELALKQQKGQDVNFEEQASHENNRCRSLSLDEINVAINDLSKTLGEGAFGKVYRGNISNNGNNVDVAVKFMSTNTELALSAFKIEKELLSACDHPNIISLVGYCDEGAHEKILVYELMSKGSLYDYLYKPKDETSRLTVEQRLEICKGVAKGLNYLHSRKDYNIIHSDLKTDNILLDDNLVPKISDFGLSRIRNVGPLASAQVTKHIQGTKGYIAPECYEPNYKVSRKADVYAFGVVLLEVLCEKPGWENLVIWALLIISKGKLPNFTPEHVVKNLSPECLRACASLIKDCLESDPNNRPSMSHVISNLDLALSLQKMNTNRTSQKDKSQANSVKRFSISDIQTISDRAFMHGGGKVYHSKISMDVLLKHRSQKRNQFVKEGSYLLVEAKNYLQNEINLFQNEIELLSVCHHANVISLVGYCDEPDDKILIYEFMSNGSMYDYLCNPKDNTTDYSCNPKDSTTHQLTVEQRLKICLGVANGLNYLHSINIIHRYLNSKNILLDRNFNAKISNFQFSTRGVAIVIQRPKDMDGYLAPELYIDGYEESQKSDVYAFAVIFLEMLSEKRATHNLVGSALLSVIKGELAKFTPEHVGAYISQECAKACENLLGDCLDGDPDKRPSMYQVVDKLEAALKLQIQEAND